MITADFDECAARYIAAHLDSPAWDQMYDALIDQAGREAGNRIWQRACDIYDKQHEEEA